MNARTATFVAVPALLVGVLLGYFIPSRTAAPETAAEDVKAPEKRSARAKAPPPPGHVADLNRLRARIRGLERQLAEQGNAASEEPVDQPATNHVEGFRPFGRPPSMAEMRARFEEMREKDPERYTQMTNNMAHWRARQQQRLQNQFDILASADTKHMTEAQRKAHETYQDLLVRQEELRDMLSPNANATDAEREAAFKELREIGHQLHDLQRTERDTLLTQTANALGLRGRDAQEVVTAIKNVYEATGGGRGGRR